nr:transposase [Methylobacterium thuringiense]
MRRYALRDDHWDRIRDLLSGRLGSVGVTAKDNRRFVEAVVYRYRAGIAWRILPERFGDGVKVQRGISRWAHPTAQCRHTRHTPGVCFYRRPKLQTASYLRQSM